MRIESRLFLGVLQSQKESTAIQPPPHGLSRAKDPSKPSTEEPACPYYCGRSRNAVHGFGARRENPRTQLDPQVLSVGIRLTRRNTAIPEIQKLREQVYRLETREVIGTRNRTTAWTNCFGSRHYQPHVQLLRPWHKVNATLAEVGDLFRTEVKEIEFDLFQIEARYRWMGSGVVGNMVEAR